MNKTRYMVKEIFYSLQGEGVRAGTANVFVRFAGCNLACNVAEHGFDCDTDFVGGESYSVDELLIAMQAVADVECSWVIFTGGEPMLQLDGTLVHILRREGWQIAIETNGTRPVIGGLDWVCVSPKPPDQAVVLAADEVKFVMAAGAPLPKTSIRATHYILSPAFKGDTIDEDALSWCIDLVKANPGWRLSVQQHKGWGVR